MLFMPDKMSCYVQNHLGLRTEFELSGQIWNFLEKIFYDYPETYFIMWRIFEHSAKCSVFLIHRKIEMPRKVELSGWTLSDLSSYSLCTHRTVIQSAGCMFNLDSFFANFIVYFFSLQSVCRFAKT